MATGRTSNDIFKRCSKISDLHDLEDVLSGLDPEFENDEMRLVLCVAMSQVGQTMLEYSQLTSFDTHSTGLSRALYECELIRYARKG